MEDILVEKDGVIREGIEFGAYMESVMALEDPMPEQSMEILEDVIALCEPLSTKELEITATTFFIDRQQKVLFGCPDQDAVIEKVTHAKKKRFSNDEIARSYRRVVEECLPLVEKYAMH